MAGPLRVAELQRALPHISTDMLYTRLNEMVEAGLLNRIGSKGARRVDFELTPKGRGAAPVLSALAVYGRMFHDGPREADEHINIFARLLDARPSLEELPGLFRANVLHVVIEVDGRSLLMVANRLCGVEFRPLEDEPHIRVSGTTEQWVQAIEAETFRDLTITPDETSCGMVALAILHRLA